MPTWGSGNPFGAVITAANALDSGDTALVLVDGTVEEVAVPALRGQTMVNVLDYGADPTDAITNAAQKTAFDAAWAASSSGIIYVPTGTYSFGTNRFASSTTRKGIVGDGPGKTILQYTSAADGLWLFWTAGSETGGNKTLTANLPRTPGAADGYYPVLKATAHGFAANDYVKVGLVDDNVNFYPTTGAAGTRRWVNAVDYGTDLGTTRGEIVQVARTGDHTGANTTSTVLLTKTPYDTYNTASAAYAVKLSMVTNLVWRDFSVVCTNPLTVASTSASKVFLIQYCENVRFENIDFTGVDEECIEGYDCLNVRVTNCHGYRLGANQNATDTGYYQGTLVLPRCASQNWVISGCSISNGGYHLFTTGGASQPGVPRNILITDCWAEAGTTPQSYDYGAAPFDTHAEGEFIYFNNCRVSGSGRYGFNSRSPYTFFENCTAFGVRNKAFWLGREGVWGNEANNCAAHGTLWTAGPGGTALWIEGDDTIVRNFTVDRSEQDGITIYQVATTALTGVKLFNVVVRNCDATAVNLGSTGTHALTGVTIRGLDIEDCSSGLVKSAGTTLTACRVHDMTTRNVTTATSGTPATLLDCFNFTGGAWAAL
jgi:hypothetical protein